MIRAHAPLIGQLGGIVKFFSRPPRPWGGMAAAPPLPRSVPSEGKQGLWMSVMAAIPPENSQNRPQKARLTPLFGAYSAWVQLVFLPL